MDIETISFIKGGTPLGAWGSIVAFGPHLAPLGDPAYFGIVSTRIKGTVRVAAPFFVGEWLEIEMKTEGDTLTLTALPTRTDPTPLFMAFCAKGAQCLVGGDQSIRPYSLDKYAGETAPIVLNGKTTLVGPDTGLEVVPLGGSLYEESQFLIAYPLEEAIPYTWTVTSLGGAETEYLNLQSAGASSSPA
jgi:hypothetical protein